MRKKLSESDRRRGQAMFDISTVLNMYNRDLLPRDREAIIQKIREDGEIFANQQKEQP